MIEKEDFCEFCDGIAKPTLVMHSFERHSQQFKYENIPALKCDKCDAVYFDGATVIKIEKEIAGTVDYQ